MSLPSYYFDFNAADMRQGMRSLLEILLYCISKLVVIASGYFQFNYNNVLKSVNKVNSKSTNVHSLLIALVLLVGYP